MNTITYKSFSQVFPYVAVADNCIISTNPDTLTAVCQLHVSEFDSEEILEENHNRLLGLLCELPEDSIVSIYYCKIFTTPDPISLNKSEKSIVNFMEKNKIDFCINKKSPEYSCFLSITIPVESEGRDFETLRKITNKNKKNTTNQTINYELFREKKDKLENFIKSLVSQIDGYIYHLTSQQILQFLGKIINHSVSNNVSDFASIFKSDWNTSIAGIFDPNPGYVFYGGNYHTVLSLRALRKESKLPQKSSPLLNTIFNHKDIAGIPFVVQHCLRIMSREKGLKIAKHRESMIAGREGAAKWIKYFEKTPEGYPVEKLRAIINDCIDQVESSGERFLEQFFHVHLWDTSLDKLDKTYKSFDSTVSATYKLKREKYNIKGAYFSLFPGNEKVETIRTILASFNIADFMPIDLPRFPFPSKKPEMQLYYHNEMDSFSTFDLFDPRCDNHNAVICGGSGSGKSFTAQDMLWQVMKYDPCIAVIDFGGEGQGSYLSFIKNLNGTYLEINFNAKFSINPFDGAYFISKEEDEKGRIVLVPDMNGEPHPLRSVALLATIARMVKASSGKEWPSNIRYEVNQCLIRYYKANNNNSDNQCNLNDFAEKYLKENTVFANTDWDIYKAIFEFIGTGANKGPYSNFFAPTQEIRNKDIVCFDMAGLKGHDRLKAVLLPTLLSMIMDGVLGNKERLDSKKFLFIDEAWRDLQGGDMQEFMVEMYRTIRKLNGQITIITQSINDILSSAVCGALTINTSYYWLVGNKHDPESLRQLSASNKDGTNKLSEYDITQIVKQQSKRDSYLLTPYFVGQLRFYPTKEFCMLATTNPNEKTILRKHMQALGVDYVTPEVLERAKNEF